MERQNATRSPAATSTTSEPEVRAGTSLPVTGGKEHGHDHDHRQEHRDGDDPDDHGHSLGWVELVRIGLTAVAVVASWLGVWKSFASFDVIALAATLLGGYPIFI
jgi:hypothetical protein